MLCFSREDDPWAEMLACWLLACLTSQQHASVSHGRNCSDNCTYCHAEIEAADQTFYLTQSQNTDTGQTIPNVDPISPGAWQPLGCQILSHWYDSTRRSPTGKAGIEPRSAALEADANEAVLYREMTRARYHGGRRLSSDDSFHNPTVIPPSALDKPTIMMRYHRRRTCSHTLPRRSPTMVALHDTRFVECRW